MDSNWMCKCGAVATLFVTDESVSKSCAKRMLPSVFAPYRFCDQDLEADTCTTQSRLNNLEFGTCDAYCQKHELECVAAAEDWNCVGYREHRCDEAASSYMLCTCGAPANAVDTALTTTANCDSYCASKSKVCLSASSTLEENCILENGLPCSETEDFATQVEYVCGADIERPELVEEMASASCSYMIFYRDPVIKPSVFCPPHTLTHTEEDSCTILAYVYSIAPTRKERTCDAYCNSFSGMKFVAAAEEASNDCNVKSTLACNEPYTSSTSDLLCTCAIDDTTMPAALAKTEISPACENLMLSPSRDTAEVSRFCESLPIERRVPSWHMFVICLPTLAMSFVAHNMA